MPAQNSDDSDPADQSYGIQYPQKSRDRIKLGQVKILVIEDEDEDWLLIQQAFQECIPQAILIRVATSAQALALLDKLNRASTDKPQLILLDLYLPTRDVGLDLLNQIKGVTSPFKYIPVIVLSHSSDQTDISECYAAGAASYMVKSPDFADWVTQFIELRQYWLETVTLPSRSSTYASRE